MNDRKPVFSVAKGDVFEDRDSRMSGRRLIVVDFTTKQRTVWKRGTWVKQNVECVVLENLADRHHRIGKQVKIRTDELKKRFRRVES